MEEKYGVPFSSMSIVASNDINVDVLYSLNKQNHQITSYGIGTNLVTCPGTACPGYGVQIDGYQWFSSYEAV